jgi:hypothetical protein
VLPQETFQLHEYSANATVEPVIATIISTNPEQMRLCGACAKQVVERCNVLNRNRVVVLAMGNENRQVKRLRNGSIKAVILL